MGPSQGLGGAGENGHLFSGCWGALAVIFRELGSKLLILGSWGALSKCDFLTSFWFLGAAPLTPLHVNITVPFNSLSQN